MKNKHFFNIQMYSATLPLYTTIRGLTIRGSNNILVLSTTFAPLRFHPQRRTSFKSRSNRPVPSQTAPRFQGTMHNAGGVYAVPLSRHASHTSLCEHSSSALIYSSSKNIFVTSRVSGRQAAVALKARHLIMRDCDLDHDQIIGRRVWDIPRARTGASTDTPTNRTNRQKVS